MITQEDINSDNNANLKFILLKDLNENFPETADELFQRAEKYCLNETGFNNLNDSDKSELIIQKIINTPELMDDNLIQMLQTGSYLKNQDLESTIFKLTEKWNNIKNHQFFTSQTATIEELQTLNENIKINLNLFDDAYQEICSHINILIKYTKSSIFWNNLPEIIVLKEKLKDKLKSVNSYEHQITLFYQNNLLKLKLIENEIAKMNDENYQEILSIELENLSADLQPFLKIQDDIITTVANFQLLPFDKILIFAEYVEKFSIYINDYYKIKNMVSTAEASKLSPDKIKKLKKIDEDISNKFKLFFETCKKTIGKYLENVKDKSAVFKARFLEPMKSKLEPKSYELLSQFADTLF